MAVTIYRDHVTDCPFKYLGRKHMACQCPIAIYSKETGTRSMKTADLTVAMKRLSDEQTLGAISPTSAKRSQINNAITIFLTQKKDLSENTLANYRCVLAAFRSFTGESAQLDSVSVEHFDSYRDHRGLSSSSWLNELTILRNFFGFCQRRGWCSKNPAKMVETPRGVKRSREVEPYTQDEIDRIITAAMAMSYTYDRLRGVAALLLMREVGLRVSDVAGLRRDSVAGLMIAMRAKKNDKAIRLPISQRLRDALDDLPNHSNKFFFWKGRSVRALERLLGKVFERSGVEGATPHRFRHTLATDMMTRGATFEDVADVLGDTPETIRLHYAKWTPAREERLGRFLA